MEIALFLDPRQSRHNGLAWKGSRNMHSYTTVTDMVTLRPLIGPIDSLAPAGSPSTSLLVSGSNFGDVTR